MQTRVKDESQSLINYELCYTVSFSYHALCYVNAPSMIKNAYAYKNLNVIKLHRVSKEKGGALEGRHTFLGEAEHFGEFGIQC